MQQRLLEVNRPPGGSAATDKAARRKRRHIVRHQCKIDIGMVIGHAPGNSNDWTIDTIKVQGVLLDLSAEGASIFTKQRFDTGQQLRLAIKLRSRTEINADATVCWLKAVPEKGGFASGVKFASLSAKEEKTLAKFLKKLEATAGI